MVMLSCLFYYALHSSGNKVDVSSTFCCCKHKRTCNFPRARETAGSQFQSHTQRCSPMTCRLDANVSLVSNPEVLQLLHERGCHLGPVGNSLPAEQKAYAALSPFFPVIPTRDQVQAFYDAVKSYKLDKASVLQLINLAPTSLVELFLVIPDCESRLTEAQQQELLDLTKQYLSR